MDQRTDIEKTQAGDAQAPDADVVQTQDRDARAPGDAGGTQLKDSVRPRLGGLSCRLVFHDVVDSTNDEAKRLAKAGRADGAIPFGTVILANAQSAGRGRMGRAFASPAADSIYVSFILKPIDGAEGTPFVTIMAAVAVCETIESVAGGEPRVKWVNDIYMDGRKVCGILAESVAGAAGGGPGAVVLGIGVNVNVPPGDFPEELRDRAGAVRMAPARRGLFAAELIRRVIDRHEELARGESPIQAYRERSLIIGREVVVIGPDGGETPAMAEGIADNGNLLVRYADGSRAALNSGEVSLRVT